MHLWSFSIIFAYFAVSEVRCFRASFRFIDEFGEEINVPTEDDTFEVTCARDPGETDDIQVHIDNRPYQKPNYTSNTNDTTTFFFKIDFDEHTSDLDRSSYSCRKNESIKNNTFEIGVIFCKRGRKSLDICTICEHGHTCGVRKHDRVCATWNWVQYRQYCGGLGGDNTTEINLNHKYLGLCRIVTSQNPDVVGESGLHYSCFYHNFVDEYRYYAEGQRGACIPGKTVPRITSDDGALKLEVGDTLYLDDYYRKAGVWFHYGDYGPVDGDTPTCQWRDRNGVVAPATTLPRRGSLKTQIKLDRLSDEFKDHALLKLSCYTNLTRSYIYVLQPPTVKVDSSGQACNRNWSCHFSRHDYTDAWNEMAPIATPSIQATRANWLNITCSARFDADVCKHQKLELRNQSVSISTIVANDCEGQRPTPAGTTNKTGTYVLLTIFCLLIGVAIGGFTFWFLNRRAKRTGTMSFGVGHRDEHMLILDDG